MTDVTLEQVGQHLEMQLNNTVGYESQAVNQNHADLLRAWPEVLDMIEADK